MWAEICSALSLENAQPRSTAWAQTNLKRPRPPDVTAMSDKSTVYSRAAPHGDGPGDIERSWGSSDNARADIRSALSPSLRPMNYRIKCFVGVGS